MKAKTSTVVSLPELVGSNSRIGVPFRACGLLNSHQSYVVRVYDAGHDESGVFHSAEWHDGDWSNDGIREAFTTSWIGGESISEESKNSPGRRIRGGRLEIFLISRREAQKYSRKGVRLVFCVVGLGSSIQESMSFFYHPFTLRMVLKKAPAMVLAVTSRIGTASTYLAYLLIIVRHISTESRMIITYISDDPSPFSDLDVFCEKLLLVRERLGDLQ
ncbi:hypothetical protein TNCV_3883711 [Trichonephila clavipes]|nr:hypothetical protein TNCV_3883711 [Trichonephila clavipes]